jgi:hypothetical protein
MVCRLPAQQVEHGLVVWVLALAPPGSRTVAYASKTGGMAEVMVRPIAVPSVIHATSASVPIRYELPSLTTRTMPSAEHVFAMKAQAARGRDIDDLKLLGAIIGIESSSAAIQVCGDFFPDAQLSARAAAVLAELFD